MAAAVAWRHAPRAADARGAPMNRQVVAARNGYLCTAAAAAGPLGRFGDGVFPHARRAAAGPRANSTGRGVTRAPPGAAWLGGVLSLLSGGGGCCDLRCGQAIGSHR